jgi:hypothetical protein
MGFKYKYDDNDFLYFVQTHEMLIDERLTKSDQVDEIDKRSIRSHVRGIQMTRVAH